MTGQDLYSVGNGPIFRAYVLGIHDADRGAGTRGTIGYCVPDAVKSGQLSDVSYRYLETHPGTRHESAAYLVREYFRDLWPCHTDK